MNINKLMLRCSLIAKDIAPKDTGNLAFNSIRAYKTPRGFRIVSLGNAAPYGSIINTGRKDRPLSAKEKRNIGWWNLKTYNAMTTYLKGSLNFDNVSYKRVAQLSKNNELRQKAFQRSIPKVGG